jgi:hypothetical protein
MRCVFLSALFGLWAMPLLAETGTRVPMLKAPAAVAPAAAGGSSSAFGTGAKLLLKAPVATPPPAPAKDASSRLPPAAKEVRKPGPISGTPAFPTPMPSPGATLPGLPVGGGNSTGPGYQSSGMPGTFSGSSAPDLPPLEPPGRKAAATPEPSPPPVADEAAQLLLAWRDPQAANKAMSELTRRYGLTVAEAVEFGELGLVVGLLQLASEAEAQALRDRLTREQPDWLADLNSSLSPLAGQRQFALAQIGHAPHAGTGGARIGLLDSGVDSLPAFARARIVLQDFVGASGHPEANAHGNAVAALMVGHDPGNDFTGVVPGAELSVAAIVRRNARREDTSVALVLAGLDWLLGQGVRVVNVSLGGKDNRLLEAAVRSALARQVALVAAAGNDGPEAPVVFPAAYPGVIAVSANDAAGNAYARSNRGSAVLLSAPGVDVWVPDAGEGRYVSGTSFSAAVVTGAVSVLLGTTPALTPAQVRERLCARARDLGTPGRDPVFGCGLLQLSAPKARRS